MDENKFIFGPKKSFDQQYCLFWAVEKQIKTNIQYSKIDIQIGRWHTTDIIFDKIAYFVIGGKLWDILERFDIFLDNFLIFFWQKLFVCIAKTYFFLFFNFDKIVSWYVW